MSDSIASSINSIVNQSNSGAASSGVIGAIKNAAAKTGVDFSYLLQKASAESGLDATAKAATSSATGLFQFTGQTWLQMVKNNGAQYGLGAYASQITTDSNGHLSVSDPATKQAILALRNDPTVSAEMAGELDKQNAASLQQNVGGKVGSTELYLAHFLGAGGASDFISTMRSNPSATGASVLPEAAAANPAVFYDKSGNARTLAQIYQHFAQKFDGTTTGTGATTQAASAASASSGISSASSVPLSRAAAAKSFAPTLMNLASLYPSATSAISSSASVIEGTPSSSTNLRSSGAGAVATNSASTMFTAMLLGQMNGNALDPAASYAAVNDSDGKKKEALSTLSAVA